MTVYDPQRPGLGALDADPDTGGAGQAPLSTLEELQAALTQAEVAADEEFLPLELFSPGEVIRLTCSTDLDQKDLKRLQLAALPLEARRKRIPDLKKLSEVAMYAGIIGEQTLTIAIRQSDGTYKDLPGGFDDPATLTAFGAAEPSVAVRRVFVKDAYVLNAGAELMEACGYGERKPGEEGDPT